jgi:hypothetical protein
MLSLQYWSSQVKSEVGRVAKPMKGEETLRIEHGIGTGRHEFERIRGKGRGDQKP